MSLGLVIPGRFNGPPASGHGGYVAGVVAEMVGGTVEVTLRKPPPLEVELTAERTDDGTVSLLDGDGNLIAEGKPATLDLAIPDLPDRDAVEHARSSSPRLRPNAAFSTCVACGPAREVGDGLRIFAGPVEGRDIVAAPWIPDDSMATANGEVGERFLWTALDCPSFAALEPHVPRLRALLGRICATVHSKLRVGEPTTVVAWPLGVDGRKLHSAGALFGETGTLAAAARMTWISIDER